MVGSWLVRLETDPVSDLFLQSLLPLGYRILQYFEFFMEGGSSLLGIGH